uniref:EGF-like domain-containing protein n=1 Tax=Magallana gigas TaxID=29159 RepID=A0A8W8NYI5_MAGGI
MVDDAMQQIRTNESTTLNKTFILSLIKDLREKAFQQSRLDFDDESCMDDDEYRVLTGFSRREFHDIVLVVTKVRWRANTLQERVEGEGLDRRGMRWSKVNVENVAPDFPCYDERLPVSVLYAYEDISYNKSTNQSHSHTDEYYDASHAVDRNTLTCTRTYNIGLNSSHKTVWVTVDIGGIFNIHSINIQFKNYEGYENRQRGRFAGFSLFVSKSGVIQGYELFEVSTEICEFIVQGCKSGVYGSNCDMSCPVNCAYSTCHSDLGTCYDCKPGWTGTLCKKECREGWYGINCSQQCVGHCRDGTFCNHVTGHCDRGCNTGWMGFICEKQCDDGTYGYDCVNNCSGHCLNNSPCNKKNGHCDMGCDQGYTNGDCSRKCPYGQFGMDCRKSCSGHCINNKPCHHVNGVCPTGCRDGYTGIYCNNSCQRGFYGSDCSQSCSPNCKMCRHTDGLCTCKAGWTGNNCTNECVQSFGENCEHPCNIDCKIQACNRFNGSCLFGCKTGKQCEQGMLESDTTKQSATSPTFWIAGFSVLLVTNFILIVAFIRLWAVYLKRTNNTHEALCCWRSNASHAVTSTELETSAQCRASGDTDGRAKISGASSTVSRTYICNHITNVTFYNPILLLYCKHC